jgi:hypothetical protein
MRKSFHHVVFYPKGLPGTLILSNSEEGLPILVRFW